MSTYMKEIEVKPSHLEIMREIANIGAGNSVTSLATLTDQRIDMSVPEVGIVSLADFVATMGGAEEISVCIYMFVEGDAPGHIAFLTSQSGAMRMADRMLCREWGETEQLDELECSCIMELGNILSCSYLTAISDMTHLTLTATPPAFALDYAAAVLSSLQIYLESVDALNAEALTIQTELGGGNESITGFFIYVPAPGSMEIILKALNMEGD